MGFSREEYWRELRCPPPGDLPNPGIETMPPASPALQLNSLLLSHRGSTLGWVCFHKYCIFLTFWPFYHYKMSLTLVIFFCLTAYFSGTNIDTPALLQLLFAEYVFFYPFHLNVCTSDSNVFLLYTIGSWFFYPVLQSVLFCLKYFIQLRLMWLLMRMELSSDFSLLFYMFYFCALLLLYIKMNFCVKF